MTKSQCSLFASLASQNPGLRFSAGIRATLSFRHFVIGYSLVINGVECHPTPNPRVVVIIARTFLLRCGIWFLR